MAGSIPPLISSSPPPLNAFDDDEEEDEDEFGGYAVAEDIDYNECMSFKENHDEKEKESTSRKEQDNTSQDSATDSGLCPDSEGVSPTPHSDEERVKNSAQMLNGHSDPEHQHSPVTLGHNVESLTNGYLDKSDGDNPNLNIKPFISVDPSPHEENSCIQIEEFDPEFGSFEFASTSTFETKQVVLIEENTGSFTEFKSNYGLFPESTKNITENGNVDEHISAGGTCDENKFEISNGTSAQDDEEFLPFDHNLDFAERIPQVLSPDRLSGSFEDLNEKVPNDSSQLENAQTFVHEAPYNNEVKSSCLNSDNDFDEDEFNEFTDFKANFPNSDIPESEHSEFSEHSKSSSEQVRLSESCVKSSQKTPQNDASDDEFSNFADFSSSDCAFVSAQSSNSAENSSYIPVKPIDDSDLRTDCDFQDWVSVFPVEAVKSSGDSCVTLLRTDDVVWTRLMPLESTPAFNYHWTDSLSNRSLLKSLSIDSRNILWGVPRFAANLNCGVLQPMKAMEPLQPDSAITAVVAASSSNAHLPAAVVVASASYAHLPAPETVPDAHFDWGSSGLTNPLDCPRPPALNLPKTLSVEAEKILSFMPDLSFMRKSYIVFPINEGR